MERDDWKKTNVYSAEVVFCLTIVVANSRQKKVLWYTGNFFIMIQFFLL